MAKKKTKHKPSVMDTSLGLSALNDLLPSILGDSYGGPSISYDLGTEPGDDPKFVLYTWTDAPVGIEILAEGDTLQDMLFQYKDEIDKRSKEK